MEARRRIACVGSRETPGLVLAWMEQVGKAIVTDGCTIVSGNAPGADQAWARGGNAVDPSRVELCLPWEYFEAAAINGKNPIRKIYSGELSHVRHFTLVQQTHPAFGRLSKEDLLLHARNAMIVEGAHVVIGYLNPNKPGGGGTGSTFRMAHRLGIQALNVADALVRAGIEQRISRGEGVRAPSFTLDKAKRW